jgi:tetratricopeptide (TPR) repeat protein
MSASRPAKRKRPSPQPSPVERPDLVRVATWVFVPALAVRLLHIWLIRDSPFAHILLGDSRAYDTWARQLAGGDWIGRDVFYQAPLYPYFLGLIYATLGSEPTVVRICQAMLGAAACVLLALAGWRLFDKRVGLGVGLALAFYPPAIFFDGLLQKAVLDGFFVCLIIYLVSRILAPDVARTGGRHVRDWLLLGLAVGGLSLTRENALVFAAVLAGWALVRRGQEARPSWARVAPAAAFLLGMVVTLSPVALRNYAVGGGLYITTSQFGANFYLGNNAYTDGTASSMRGGRGSAEYERRDAEELAERALARRLTPAEVSQYWTGQAVAFITSQPRAWAQLMWRKFVLLWNAVEALDTESQESYAQWSWPIRLGGLVGHFGVLVPLAVLGVIVTWRDRQRLAILYWLAAAYAASVLVFFIYARYRYPLVPFLLLLAAVGVARAGAAARGWSAAQRTGVLAVLAAVAVFTNWPLLSRLRMRAITEHNLGAALQADGRVDEAIAQYERATALVPDYAPGYNNLGTALALKGREADAIAAYERALSIEPDYPNARYNLANALLRAGRTREAIDQFRLSLTSSPGGADVHNNLGIALTEEGRFAEAEVEFRAALTFEPDSARVHRNLGEILARQNRGADAIAHLRRAVELDPGALDARYALAAALVEQERLDEAAAVFAAMLAKHPDMADARSDFALVLASLGRLDEAVAQLERAVADRPADERLLQNLRVLRARRGRS